jgi:hypothetical protein
VTPKWPLRARVEVEWRDSASRGGWDSVGNHRQRRQVGPCRSIGYLLTQDKDVVQLAQSMSSMTQDVNDTVTIPRENVIRMKRLDGLK